MVPVCAFVPYASYEQVQRLAGDCAAHIVSTDWTEEVCLHLVFKTGEEQTFIEKMRELMAGCEHIEAGAPEFAEF